MNDYDPSQFRQTFSTAEWQTLKEEMRDILIGVARTCSTITYSELAALIRTAHMHQRAPLFHKLIRDMDHDEDKAGRPSLAALVVRKDSGIPGQGFYAGASAPEGQTFDPQVYWQSEFDKVCEYWGEQPKLL
jgi:hypothetical protein